jgi:hypothetical protein
LVIEAGNPADSERLLPLTELNRALEARLTRHPDAALIRSLPGMGAVLTADQSKSPGVLFKCLTADFYLPSSPDALIVAENQPMVDSTADGAGTTTVRFPCGKAPLRGSRIRCIVGKIVNQN